MAELSGQGPIVHSGATSVVDSTAKARFGSHGWDAAGNEYVYVDFQQALLAGELVVFDHNFAATRITGASTSNNQFGWVGVVVGTVSASDRFGWVQVRGVHTATWATSDATTGNIAVARATTDIGALQTGATSDIGRVIFGIHIATDPDTCASTALTLSSQTCMAPCTVILNYPFISGQLLGHGDTT